MNEKEIQSLIQKQREFFFTGATLSVDRRIEALKRLKSCIQEHETEIEEALKADLGKSSFETYMCEVGLVLSEINYMIKNTPAYAKEEKVHTPVSQYAAKSYRKPCPFGVVLIMSPWNYPFLLSLDPLIDAVAAGNTVIIKPSAYSPNTSRIIEKIITQSFDSSHAAVVTGGREENSCLLGEHFDYIFFTGSRHVGREVMEKAARYLTPVTLELGGKSPCIVDKTAKLKAAARRIVFGKFLNCGQTCVAPDYVYCDEEVREELIRQIKKQIKRQYSAAPLNNKNYGKIINEKHFSRILGLMDSQKVIFGGESNPETFQIAPTVMDGVTFDDAVMQEEIFGPLLPILTYRSLDEAVDRINSMPRPLALYLFTKDKTAIEKVTSRCLYGGGCINDTIIHLATSEMGFGGIGESGMGSYHGKEGFDTFTHYKSIVNKKIWPDLPIRYQPYRKINKKLLKKILK